MTTKIRASLEEAIQEWADKASDESLFPPAYWPDSQTSRMAEAAYAVLMASIEGQEYQKQEDNSR